MRPHALHPGAIQGKEGIKFCHLATLTCDSFDFGWSGGAAAADACCWWCGLWKPRAIWSICAVTAAIDAPEEEPAAACDMAAATMAWLGSTMPTGRLLVEDSCEEWLMPCDWRLCSELMELSLLLPPPCSCSSFTSETLTSANRSHVE